MPSVSIIRSDHPEGPADEEILRGKLQEKRTDPEATVLREFIKACHDNFKDLDKLSELTNDYSEKLGITPKELIHKRKIFSGYIEDDEVEWREEKYGKTNR